MATTDIQVKQRRKIRRKINFYFYSLVLGTVLSFSSAVALQSLQTSINIEGNVGSIALTSAYFGSVVYSLFVAPITMKRFGTGLNLVISDVSYLIYCASNYYPEIYVLVPGSIASSVARSLLLPATSIAAFQLAEQFYRCGSQAEEVYINRFQSRYISLFSSVSIVGNAISFAALSGSRQNIESDEIANVTIASEYTKMISTTASQFANRSEYYHCGVNDCQDPEIVEENLNQYVPPDKISTYILVSAACGINLISFVIHAFIYPGIGKFGHKLYNLDKEISLFLKPNASSTSLQFAIDDDVDQKNNNKETDVPAISNKKENYDNPAFVLDSQDFTTAKKTNDETNSTSKTDAVHIDEKSMDSHNEDRDGYWTTLKKTGKFFIRPQSMLIGLTPVRNGMIVGFIFSDITRAYASCVGGVQLTGLIAMTFGSAGIPVSLLYGHLVKYTGRNAIMIAGFLLEMSVYIGCYLWVPDPDTIYFVFFIFIGHGTVNAMLYITVNVVYNEYFPTESHIATNVWNFWIQGATGLQFALSTFMCMVDKIYLGMAFLTFSILMRCGVSAPKE
ncbi:protein unc-93 homolog A-like isoform X2 [Styela clava]